MIKKERLLRSIELLIRQEESLVPLLNRHISSALFFSGLQENSRKTIVDRFQSMVIKQQEHLEILKGIKKDIEEGGSDVY